MMPMSRTTGKAIAAAGHIVRALVPAACLLVASHACAGPDGDTRMYQWREPATGTLRMSGDAPEWYRSDRGGPRVKVFEHGVLVDDTAIEVRDATRAALRRQAVGHGAFVPDPASSRSPAASAPDAAQAPPSPDAAPPRPGTAAAAEPDPTDAVAAMKRLLEIWDRQRAEAAKSVVDQATGGAGDRDDTAEQIPSGTPSPTPAADAAARARR